MEEKVSVVFHGAATLKLEANLKDAVEMNLAGTWRVIQVCKKMTKLEVSLVATLKEMPKSGPWTDRREFRTQMRGNQVTHTRA